MSERQPRPAARGAARTGVLHRSLPGISKKMLTQTLRQMERDGLVVRTVHAVIPPKVEYRLTDLGFSLADNPLAMANPTLAALTDAGAPIPSAISRAGRGSPNEPACTQKVEGGSATA